MEFAFIVFAFFCGLGVKLLGFPPLVGFLLAGFALNFFGFESNQTLTTLADLGITLMLFTIGLKLNLKDLIKTEVWLGAVSHMVTWILVVSACFWLLAMLGLGLFKTLDLQTIALLAFALSFSSTVCVVKVLEESGELKTRHGKLAVGILVMQDIIAVLFLVVATGKIPSVYALGLPLLLFIRPLWSKLLEQSGHGELLPLTGFLFTFGGYYLFELVGVKGDFGALIVGMIVATHPKSTELYKALLSFKDLFLIGFFLSIGFTALPTLEMLLTATLLTVLLPLKFSMFFMLLSKLRLRARTSYLSGLVLGNFSEFGLIVAALLAQLNLIGAEWLVILAISVSLSFVITGYSYRSSHDQYKRLKHALCRYEHTQRRSEDEYVQPAGAKVLVIGLGRVGQGAYQALHSSLGDQVWGMDADPLRIKKLRKHGLQVLTGDGEDSDLWENTRLDTVELVLLALPSIEDMSNITQQLRSAGYKGKMASIARYEDEIQPLLSAGIDKVFNFFTEAGQGFADESLQMLEQTSK